MPNHSENVHAGGDIRSHNGELDVIARIEHLGIVPVVQIRKPEDAIRVAEGLQEGGLQCAEFTFRTPAAAESLVQVRDRYPEFLLGAGTVLSARQVNVAVEAGAQFIMSPGMNPTVVDQCCALGVTVLPGVCTPTDVQLALDHGIRVVKFFPAEAIGGTSLLKAFAGPFPDVRYVPTGGIGPSNLKTYLSLPQVLACAGSWMVRMDLVATGDFTEVARLAREAVTLVAKARAADHSGGV